MKKLYYTILATAAALTTASCVDLLNTAPENQIASENSQNHRIPDSQVRGERVEPWGEADYLEALNALAESLEMSLLACAQRYGTVSLPDSEQGWRFHPALGFTKER
jgi:hypothetical protein